MSGGTMEKAVLREMNLKVVQLKIGGIVNNKLQNARNIDNDNDTSQQGYIKYDLSYDLQQIIEDSNKEIEKKF